MGGSLPAGAYLEPPLWASTTTKNPDYHDTLYVDSLIGPNTVNTMAEATIAAFEDHGAVSRTVDTGSSTPTKSWTTWRAVGVDMKRSATPSKIEASTASTSHSPIC